MSLSGRQYNQRRSAIQFRLRISPARDQANSHQTRDVLHTCCTTQAGTVAAAGARGGGGCDGGFSFGVPAFTTAFTGLIRI